jgi:hypothetical protein
MLPSRRTWVIAVCIGASTIVGTTVLFRWLYVGAAGQAAKLAATELVATDGRVPSSVSQPFFGAGRLSYRDGEWILRLNLKVSTNDGQSQILTVRLRSLSLQRDWTVEKVEKQISN